MKRLLFLTLLLTAVSAQAQSTQDLFQQALRLEKSQGDLPGAIALYEKIADAPGGERGTAAQALFNLGRAYEALGRSEASGAYRRLVQDYAEYDDLVTGAQERLRALRPATPQPAFEVSSVLAGGNLNGSSISDDGRYFINTDWSTRRLAYQEIGKDEITVLTPGRDFKRGQYQQFGRMSPDNERIAYHEFRLGAGEGGALWIWDKSTQVSTKLWQPPNAWLEPSDWSPDGSQLLVGVADDLPNDRFVLLDAETGEVTGTVSLPLAEKFGPRGCLVGPKIAVVTLNDGVFRADLSTDSLEMVLGGGARLLACSRSAGKLVFADEASGDRRIWMVDMKDGRPSGSPSRLLNVSASAHSLGLTSDGDLVYSSSGNRAGPRGIFRYSPSSLTIGEQVETLPQGSVIVGWTPDGSRFAHGFELNEFLVREENSERVLVLDSWTWGVDWTRDGELLRTQFRNDPENTYWVEPEGGTRVDSLIGYQAGIGADGSALWFVDRQSDDRLCVKERRPRVAEATEIVCYQDDQSTSGVEAEADPRGERVRVETRNQDSSAIIVRVVDLDTAAIWEVGEFNWYYGSRWLPDGRVIVLRRPDQGGAEFTVYAPDSEPVRAFVRFGTGVAIRGFALHPTQNLMVLDSYIPEEKEFEGFRVAKLWE